MLGISYDRRDPIYDRDRQWVRDDWANQSIGGSAQAWHVDPYITSPNLDPDGDGFAQTFNRPSQAQIDLLFNQQPAGTIPTNTSFSVAPNGTVYSGIQGAVSSAAAGAYRWPEVQNGGLQYRDDVVFRKLVVDGTIRQNTIHELLRSPLERTSMFAWGSYDLTDNIRTIGQLSYTNSRTTTIFDYAPATQGSSITVPHGTGIYAPSLSSNGRDTIKDYQSGGRFGLDCPATGGCTNTQAFPLPREVNLLLDSRTTPNAPVSISRALDFAPPRINTNQIQTFQVLYGLDGKIPSLDWTWDASLSYGESNSTILNQDFVALTNYRAIAQSPNFGRNVTIVGNQQGNGVMAGRATCSSGLPIFGDAPISQDCLDAITATATASSALKQTVFEANIQGGVLDLPAGKASAALGYQYRHTNYSFTDDFTEDQFNFTNQLVGLPPVGSSAGSMQANEVYAETLIPILAHLPAIEDLKLNLSVRYSDYDTIGSVTTYGALVDWSFTKFARLRGGYEKANRAPNIAELFLARTQVNGREQYGDQCSMRNTSPVSPTAPTITGGPSDAQRAQSLYICQQLMGPGSANYYQNLPFPPSTDPRSQYARFLQLQPAPPNGQANTTISAAGNPNVKDEQADTITIGLVLDSPLSNRWVQGLTASVDYYDIKIKDIIALGTQDDTYIQCLSIESNPNRDLNDPNCQRIHRDQTSGTILPTFVTYTNDGTVHTQGYDVQINWNAPDLGFVPGRFSVNVIANILKKYETQLNDNIAPVDWVGTTGNALNLQGGAYRWRTFTQFSYRLNDLNFSLRWRHFPAIDPPSQATQTVNSYTD